MEKKRKSVIQSEHDSSSSSEDEKKNLDNVKLEIVEINNNDKQNSFPPETIATNSKNRTSLVITEPDEVVPSTTNRRLSVASNCSSVSSLAASAISSISRPSIIILNHHQHHNHSENAIASSAVAAETSAEDATQSLASNCNHNHNNLRRSVSASCNSPASSIVTIDEILNGYNAQIIDDGDDYYGSVELRKSPVSIHVGSFY